MTAELAKDIAGKIADRMERASKPVTIGISNKHVHLTKEDFKAIFGADAEMTVYRKLVQPGQFACAECVDIETEKNTIKKVRIIGPYRKHTQIELSVSDSVKLGLVPPVRDSGKLENTPGIKISGPKGSITVKDGVILAKRHIHFTPADAKEFKVTDGQDVRVRCGIGGARELVFEKVLCRVSDSYALEMHVDIEEANAAMLKNGDKVYIV